jgi:hypothetical protein
MDKAIQYNMNWRMESLFLNQDIKASLSKKADTKKSNGNAHWWRTTERKNLNVMYVDALTIKERTTLLRHEKCFHCKKTGHMGKDCPPLQQRETSKQKKMDPARFAYTIIKALTKEQRESFTKMVMEDKDEKDFWNREMVSPSLSIEHVQVAQIKKNTMSVDIWISGESLGQKRSVKTATLLDTGEGGKFINQNFV